MQDSPPLIVADAPQVFHVRNKAVQVVSARGLLLTQVRHTLARVQQVLQGALQQHQQNQYTIAHSLLLNYSSDTRQLLYYYI